MSPRSGQEGQGKGAGSGEELGVEVERGLGE